ncbi:hypothetical protein ACO2Q3_11960 [Caulobacter sp. KR2-114]|uniref:hypothetical protein n=1 Tax=Caulobacter sp. KR2-114 TaxID=3400912 RepID=UPI003C0FCDD8
MAGPLREFAPDLWLADGPVVSAIAGFRYPTRMAVMRLGDGGLALWSPVAMDADLRAAVEALGPVRWLIAPNALHDSFIGEVMAAWPDAQALAPPGLQARRPELAFAGALADAPPAAWAGALERVIVPNSIASEAVFFHRPSGAVIFTDLLQHFRPGWFTGWRALVARLDLMTGPEPAVPRKFRAAVRDRQAARAAVEAILDWPAQRVLMAHGEPVTSDAPAFLRRAFRWLTG